MPLEWRPITAIPGHIRHFSLSEFNRIIGKTDPRTVSLRLILAPSLKSTPNACRHT